MIKPSILAKISQIKTTSDAIREKSALIDANLATIAEGLTGAGVKHTLWFDGGDWGLTYAKCDGVWMLAAEPYGGRPVPLHSVALDFRVKALERMPEFLDGLHAAMEDLERGLDEAKARLT